MERVYEIGRVFRNEGLDTRHNPEFTLMELYQAYTDYHGMMDLTENLYRFVAQEVLGTTQIVYKGIEMDLGKPFERITMVDAVKKYAGVDWNEVETLEQARELAKAHNLEFEERHKKGDILNLFFEEYVEEKIESFRGYSVENLCKNFAIVKEKRPKNLEAMLAYRMLGIKGNHAEEFEKANIVIKTIRIGRNNKIKESMSFPTFKFTELIKEKWETSTFGNYLEQTRFLFVIYKYNEKNELILKGCQFWNIPYKDLQVEVRSVWEKTVSVIKEGVQIIEKNGKRMNNFPNASDNRVCHVRPHGQNALDTYPLPDGREYTKQCFWLNNTYILSQIDKKFLED